MDRQTIAMNILDIDERLKNIHAELEALHDMKDDLLEQLEKITVYK